LEIGDWRLEIGDCKIDGEVSGFWHAEARRRKGLRDGEWASAETGNDYLRFQNEGRGECFLGTRRRKEQGRGVGDG
jgi:hypothetical protein